MFFEENWKLGSRHEPGWHYWHPNASSKTPPTGPWSMAAYFQSPGWTSPGLLLRNVHEHHDKENLLFTTDPHWSNLFYTPYNSVFCPRLALPTCCHRRSHQSERAGEDLPFQFMGGSSQGVQNTTSLRLPPFLRSTR